MMNQKEATYLAIILAFENAGVSFEEGDVAKEILTTEMRTEVRETLFDQFRGGEISFKEEFTAKLNDDSELKKYIAGLVSNWVKKDKRLNGNVKYQILNPGSRAGQGDDQVKALRSLIKQLTVSGPNTEGLAEAKEALVARQAEIAAAKAVKSSPINVDSIPEHLRHLVKTSN